MGVKRAVELARALADSPPSPAPGSGLPASPKKIFTLGPLIHNPTVLEDLRRRGVEILDEARLFAAPQYAPQYAPAHSLHDAVVIIRAHGISPGTEARLRGLGAEVVDATCPKVRASQLKAMSLAKQGYRLFLAGEESHAEITGIRGYAEEGWLQGSGAGRSEQFLCVVNSAEEALKAAAELSEEDRSRLNSPLKTALIAQTTISKEEFKAVGEAISRYISGLEIINTICDATAERQDSLRELLLKADTVVIAGGKASANTRRLLAIARASGKPCAIVETADDIPPEFFRFNTVGIAAGASTPDTVIDAIELALDENTEI